MAANNVVTRRTVLGKGLAAGLAALGLSALARPAATRAEADLPPTKESEGSQRTCVLICDKNGRNCKLCCYDEYGYPDGCTPVHTAGDTVPRRR